MRESDVAELANFAQVAKQLPPGGEFYTTREIIQTVSRLAVGHGVAKGAARVAFTTKVLNALGAVDKVSKHQILDAIVDVKFDGPLIQKNTPVAVAISAGAALSGLNDDEEQ